MVDARLPDGHVQVPDLGQDVVHRTYLVLQVLHHGLLGGVHRCGVIVKQPDQALCRGADDGVIRSVAGVLVEHLQLGQEVVELGLHNAELAVALAHLVQDVGQLVQAVQPGLGLAQLGLLIPVADIQEGVPQLGHAVGDHAVADIQIVAVGVPGAARGVEGDQVHPLAGVPLGVDVRDIVARHIQGRLRGVDAQPGGGK